MTKERRWCVHTIQQQAWFRVGLPGAHHRVDSSWLVDSDAEEGDDPDDDVYDPDEEDSDDSDEDSDDDSDDYSDEDSDED